MTQRGLRWAAMRENPYWIAPEGLPFIAIALLLTLGAGYFFGKGGAFVPFLLLVFCVWFFRDPSRQPPAPKDEKTETVASPADGTVIDIVEVEEPRFLHKKVRRISIFMSPLNVHVNRSPVEGTVQGVAYNPGKFMNAAAEKASMDNEQNGVHMKTPNGVDVIFVQIAGFIARRIVCYLKAGDSLSIGQRMGLIRFGSRVDVYVPLDADIQVHLKQTVQAGQTILARLPIGSANARR